MLLQVLNVMSFFYVLLTSRFYNIRLRDLLNEMETHIFLKPDWYSIQNLVDIKNGELSKQLQCMIVACTKHITNCQVKQIIEYNNIYNNIY